MLRLARKLRRKISNPVLLVLLFKNWPHLLSVHLGHSRSTDFECIMRNGIRFRVQSIGDPFTICSIWARRVWTPPGYEVRQGYTVVDIGAHIGAFSIMAATRAQGVRVVSYEPDPKNFAVLVGNVRLNGLDNIEPLLLAVAGRIEKRKLFTNPQGEASSLLQPVSGSSSQTAEDVNCTTLTEVLKHVGKCDLLKMNCEGAEYEILLNTSDDNLKKVERMVLDCHDIQGHSVHDLKSHLEKAGFKVRLVEQWMGLHVYLHAVRMTS